MYNTQSHQEQKFSDRKPTIHKVQPIHGSSSWVLVLPKPFISKLQIEKGDYVKCSIIGNKLEVEKPEL
jgi:hypothetical protein